MFEIIKNIFKGIVKFLSISNTDVTMSMFSLFSIKNLIPKRLFETSFWKGILDNLFTVAKTTAKITTKSIIKGVNTMRAINVIIQDIFKKKEREEVKMPTQKGSDIDFSDDLETYSPDEIDFGDKELWFEKKNVKMRTKKDIMQDIFEEDVNKVDFTDRKITYKEKDEMSKLVKRNEIKKHFLDAKIERANIRYENKPTSANRKMK